MGSFVYNAGGTALDSEKGSGRTVPGAQSAATHAHHCPRISYFISRNNGTLVPLIPADELPFRLQGVPQVMTIDQTCGMQHIGMAPYSGLAFKAEHAVAALRPASQPPMATRLCSQSSAGPKQFLPPDALARQALAKSTAALPPSAHEVATNWRKPVRPNPEDGTQALIDAIVGSGSGAETAARVGYMPKSAETEPPSGAVPDQEKKEFCTYWIRTGECDYTQQGCLYKHEMPDKATLEKIGFRGTPRWWLEANQAVKMSERASVGPIVKPSVWLASKADSSSDTEGDEGKPESKNTMTTPPSAETSSKSDRGAADRTEPKITKTAAVAAQVANKARQHSASSDLIDFAPLSPSSRSSTASLTPLSSSSEERPVPGTCTPSTSPELEPMHQRKANSSASVAKVFVPAGESPAAHIAQAKRRVTRDRLSRTRGPGNETNAMPLDKQIQILQKTRSDSGLMASKHASPAKGRSATVDRCTSGYKRDSKAGCRIRRPASASSPAATTAGRDAAGK